MDNMNTSTLLDVSELLSTISANILLDLPVFCEDTTEPYFRAPAPFLPTREGRDEILQNSVPLLQLSNTTIQHILSSLSTKDAISFGRTCRQLRGVVFGKESEMYWKHKVEELKPSESIIQTTSNPAEAYQKCSTMRRHWKAGEWTQSTTEAHISLIKCLELDGVKQTLVTGSSDKKVKTWKLDGRNITNKNTYSGQNCGVVGLLLNGDNLRIGYKNGVIKDVDMQNGSTTEVATGSVTTGFSFCGNVVVAYERAVTLFDSEKLQVIGEYTQHHRPVNYSKLYTPQIGTSASCDKTVDFWDIRNIKTTSIRLKGHHAGVNYFDFCDEKIVTASNDKTMMVWDLRKHDTPLKTLQNHTAEVIFVKQGTDKFISSSKDMKISLFSSTDFSLINTINTHSVVSSLTFDDQYLFCGCSSGELLMYDFS
ncbi:F-box/WD repeat-containing protein [Entamoeba marina]